MSDIVVAADPRFFSRERVVAAPSFNRWLVPPAALAIHLCIGMSYGFSVFWLPLSRAVGVTQPIACPTDMGFFAALVATGCDWKISQLGWMYTLFFVLLGCATAILGGWVERAGPRAAALVSAICWCGGLLISALGVYLHQLWMLWLGSGVIGGVGLGLGYLSPVSTLIKWFPDRRGMATGMAIMGFGGGAMIGAPLADWLMRQFATETSVGVWQTFVVMAGIYAVFMVGGALSYRVPREGWTPAGWTPPAATAMVSSKNVALDVACRTPQFWLIWAVLCLNVSAGIGVIGMASPMLQEVFGGRLIGLDVPFASLDAGQKTQIAVIGAGFTGLLSLFNIGGRFFWATSSDKLGRKLTYAIFFALGFALYAAVPTLAGFETTLFFVLALGVIISMYGGGFATMPAYLADIFGAKMVGAIFGRLLTAWATAGVLGPALVNYLREHQLAAGLPNAQAYNETMYILAGFLALGMVCNLLVRPVAERHHMADEPTEVRSPVNHDAHAATGDAPPAPTAMTSPVLVAAAWVAVGAPLAIGVLITLQKTAILLR